MKHLKGFHPTVFHRLLHAYKKPLPFLFCVFYCIFICLLFSNDCSFTLLNIFSKLQMSMYLCNENANMYV